MTITFEPLMQFWCPTRFNISKYWLLVWKHQLYPLGLGGDLKKWDEHIWGLALFVLLTQSKGDDFKLHNMVSNKKSDWKKELCPTIKYSLKPSLVNNFISFFLFFTKVNSSKIYHEVEVFIFACLAPLNPYN